MRHCQGLYTPRTWQIDDWENAKILCYEHFASKLIRKNKKRIQHHPWWSCLHPTSWVYPILHVKLREVPPPHGSVTCVQFQSERWPRETPHSTAWAKQLSRHMSDNKVLWALATWGIFCCFCSSWDVIWHLFCTSWLKKMHIVFSQRNIGLLFDSTQDKNNSRRKIDWHANKSHTHTQKKQPGMYRH